LPFAPCFRLPLRVLLAALAAVVALVAAGCGGGGGDENADPASVAPKNAPIYLTGFVRPEGDQKSAVESIAKKVAGVDDPGKAIQDAIDRQLENEKAGINYQDDIKPWLGRRAAFVASAFGGESSTGAFIVAAKDKDKAKDTIDKAAKSSGGFSERSYKGVDYRFGGDKTAAGVVGDFVVVGNEPEFKRVVDASKGDSLADNKRYDDVAGQAKDKLGFGFVDVRGLIGGLSASGQLPAGVGASTQPLLGNSNQPVTLALDAKSDQVTTTIAGPTARSVASKRQASVLSELPGDAWAAFGLGDVGGALKRAIAQFSSGGIGAGVVQTLEKQLRVATGLDVNRDIVAAIGDVGLFASGSSLLQVGGGAVITTPDPAAARRLVAKLGALIARQGASSGVRVGATSIAGGRGVRIRSPRLPGSINLVVRGSRLVAAYGDAATRSALRPTSKLADSPDFQQASATLGQGATTALYVSFGPIAQLVGSSGSSDAAQAQRILGALKNLVIGGTTQGNTATGKIVINLK
jgi:hypothetical protein